MVFIGYAHDKAIYWEKEGREGYDYWTRYCGCPSLYFITFRKFYFKPSFLRTFDLA